MALLKGIQMKLILVSLLLLGPSINFYLNDIIQYMFGMGSVSAIVYILLALIGISAYPCLFKKGCKNKYVGLTIVFMTVVMILSYFVHPSIGSLIIDPDYNPLHSVGLFLFFYGFPLTIFFSLQLEWERFLSYLFYFSVPLIVLAALDYYFVMLRIGGDLVNYMSFSYNQLLAASICAVYGFKNRNVLAFILSFISLLLIFLGGARGSLLCLLLLYFALMLYNINAKKAILSVVILAFVLVSWKSIFNSFLSLSSGIVDDIGGFSRTLYKITEGEMFQSGSRDNISRILCNAISENPLGYGLLGDRYILSQHNLTGYAHSIYLEFLCDFGWIIGGFLLVLLFGRILLLFLKWKQNPVYFVFLSLLPAGIVMLFMSGSFLDEAFAFWALLGIIYNKSCGIKRNMNSNK